MLVIISDCLWKAGNGPKSCTGCQAGTANSRNFRVELRTHVVLCVLLLFGYAARAFPCFLGLRDWGQRSHRTRV